MAADPGRSGRDDGGRDERIEDAWAQIVAGYDRHWDDSGRAAPWPAAEDLPPGPPVAEHPDTDRLDTDRLDTGQTDTGHTDTDSDRPDTETDSDTEADTAADADRGHWVPPAPPPLPRPVGAMGAAWVALVLGPLVLLVATVLGWQLPGLLTAACIVGFVGGLVFLIANMDGGQQRDGWDDGAQV